jgi:hypothetical protein
MIISGFKTLLLRLLGLLESANFTGYFQPPSRVYHFTRLGRFKSSTKRAEKTIIKAKDLKAR